MMITDIQIPHSVRKRYVEHTHNLVAVLVRSSEVDGYSWSSNLIIVCMVLYHEPVQPQNFFTLRSKPKLSIFIPRQRKWGTIIVLLHMLQVEWLYHNSHDKLQFIDSMPEQIRLDKFLNGYLVESSYLINLLLFIDSYEIDSDMLRSLLIILNRG